MCVFVGALTPLIVSLVGCGPSAKGPPPSLKDARASATQSFPTVVVDGLQREVRIARSPKRIISLAPKNTELLYAVGAGDRLVAVTDFCNYPAEAQKLPEVGGFTVSSLSLERIVSLQPDLIVSAGQIQQPIIDELERMGFPVIALAAESLDGLFAEIQLLGRITDCQPQADELVAAMQRRVDRIRQQVAAIPPEERVSVLYHVWGQPLTAAGPASFIGEIIRLAGGDNIIDDPEANYLPISEEFVLERNPDVILLPTEPVSVEQLRKRPGWSAMGALKNDRVYHVDGDLISRCGPRLVEALEQVAWKLYPERFEET